MDLEKRTIDVEDAAKITVNITVDRESIVPQEKKSGNEEDLQVNTYENNEANKSNDENAGEKIENREQ